MNLCILFSTQYLGTCLFNINLWVLRLSLQGSAQSGGLKFGVLVEICVLVLRQLVISLLNMHCRREEEFTNLLLDCIELHVLGQTGLQ